MRECPFKTWLESWEQQGMFSVSNPLLLGREGILYSLLHQLYYLHQHAVQDHVQKCTRGTVKVPQLHQGHCQSPSALPGALSKSLSSTRSTVKVPQLCQGHCQSPSALPGALSKSLSSTKVTGKAPQLYHGHWLSPSAPPGALLNSLSSTRDAGKVPQLHQGHC